jgi:hypothetical protein
VTHKGAAADAGHYIGFVKKSVFHPGSDADDVGEDWYKFDDDKVSIFPAEKLATLDGGGKFSMGKYREIQTHRLPLQARMLPRMSYCIARKSWRSLLRRAYAYVLLIRSYIISSHHPLMVSLHGHHLRES